MYSSAFPTPCTGGSSPRGDLGREYRFWGQTAFSPKVALPTSWVTLGQLLSLYFHSFIRRMEISTAFPHWVVGGTQEMNLVPCMYSMLNNGGCCLFPTWLTSKAMAVCPRTSLILRASRIIVVPEVSCVTKIGNASCLIFGTLIWGKKNFFWFKSSV